MDHQSGNGEAPQPLAPETFDELLPFVNQLRTGHPTGIEKLKLIAADLRRTSNIDPALNYLYGEGEALAHITRDIEALLVAIESSDTKTLQTAEALGEAAVTQIVKK